MTPLTHRHTQRDVFSSLPRDWLALSIAAIALIIIKWIYPFQGTHSPWLTAGILLLAFAAGFIGLRIGYDRVNVSLRILVRPTVLIIGGYAIVAGVTIPPGLDQPFPSIAYAEPAWKVLLGIWTILALWRPSFAIGPLISAVAAKSLAAQAFAMPRLSGTDYLALVEIGLFGAFTIVLANLLNRKGTPIKGNVVQSATLLAFFIGLSAHFANYFYSAIAKLTLQQAWPWTWALWNPTWTLAENATLAGTAPLLHWPAINQFIIETYLPVTPLANTLLLLGQLAAVIVIRSRRWAMALIIFYDVTHVAIFVVSGIFFWKWILLNGVLVAAVAAAPANEFRRLWPASSLMVIVAPLIFHIVWLGWYDTPAMNNYVIKAVTRDGNRVVVPSNFFGPVSVSAAQSRLGTPDVPTYPTGTFGSTGSFDVAAAANNNCDFSRLKEQKNRYRRPEADIRRTFRRYHGYILTNLDANGHIAYDLYPHHIWSNPWAYEPFRALDKREIIAYEIRVDRLCSYLTPQGGIETRILEGTTPLRINVGEDVYQ